MLSCCVVASILSFFRPPVKQNFKNLFDGWLLYWPAMEGSEVMEYTLKSGLSKTVIYNTIVDHNDTGIRLPPMRLCTFNRRRNKYFLVFDQIDCTWSVSLFQWDGSICYQFTKIDWFEYQENLHYTDFPLQAMPFDYFLQRGMLRAVS